MLADANRIEGHATLARRPVDNRPHPDPSPRQERPPSTTGAVGADPSRTSVNGARRSVLSSGGSAACPRQQRRSSPSHVTTPDLSCDLPATQPSQPADGSPRPLPITWREVRRFRRHDRSSWLWITCLGVSERVETLSPCIRTSTPTFYLMPQSQLTPTPLHPRPRPAGAELRPASWSRSQPEAGGSTVSTAPSRTDVES
jgi:hypothetical protein